MNLAKRLRKNQFVNKLFRGVFKKLLAIFPGVFVPIVKRWPVSGIVRCEFEGISFNYYNECDDGLVNYFYYDLPYAEKNDLLLFLELSKHSSTIIDIGANTGLFSVLCSISNSGSKIHAIEPYEPNTKRMAINSALNQCNNLTIHQLAMGESDGVIDLTTPLDGRITDVSSLNESHSKSFYQDIKWTTQKVQLVTLDNFRKKHGLKIDLIKCDVETLEMSVFKGARQTFLEDRPTVLFECLLSEESKNFFNIFLSEYNYYAYMPMDGGLVYLRDGLVTNPGLNYLITPIRPSRSFISFKELGNVSHELLLRP